MPLDQAIAIVDVDDAIRELGLADADYARVERLVNSASARLERRCQTVFRARTVNRTYDGDGTPILRLAGPVLGVNWVTISGIVDDRANYFVDQEAGRLIRPGTWPVGLRNLVVDARLGFDPLPHEVREACLLMLRRSARPAGDLRSERIGDYSYERFDERGDSDIPDDAEALVLPFVRWSF